MEDVKEKNQAARKFSPLVLCSTTDITFLLNELSLTLMLTLLPSQVAGSFSRNKRNLDLRIVVLEIEIETLRNLPSLE